MCFHVQLSLGVLSSLQLQLLNTVDKLILNDETIGLLEVEVILIHLSFSDILAVGVAHCRESPGQGVRKKKRVTQCLGEQVGLYMHTLSLITFANFRIWPVFFFFLGGGGGDLAFLGLGKNKLSS